MGYCDKNVHAAGLKPSLLNQGAAQASSLCPARKSKLDFGNYIGDKLKSPQRRYQVKLRHLFGSKDLQGINNKHKFTSMTGFIIILFLQFRVQEVHIKKEKIFAVTVLNFMPLAHSNVQLRMRSREYIKLETRFLV